MKPADKRWTVLKAGGREVAAVARFGPLALLAVLLAIALLRTDLAASGGLFQSPLEPESPLATPTSVPPTRAPSPTKTPVPVSPATATTIPTEQPTQTEVPSPTVAPTEAPPTATALPPTPTDTAIPPRLLPPTKTPLPRPTSTPEEQGVQRYADDSSNLKFEWRMLFDSVALGLSYIWLCCGALVLVGIPVVFLALWVASRRRLHEEE